MKRYLWAAVSVLSLGCGAEERASEATLGETSLAVESAGGGKPRACSSHRDDAFPLPAEACATRRLVGAAVSADALAADAAYKNALATEFSYVTPENAMKWGVLQPVDATHWDFTQADAIVAAAQSADQSIKGHALVWHQQLPPFVTDALSAKELKQDLERHIATVVGHYRGVVRAWDVVNEAIADDGTLRDSVFSRKFGQDFIANAFRRAHQADKKAKLFYNDYGTETANTKSNAVYALVSSLQSAGVPIDGVGFQMHLDARFPPSEADIEANFARFADLGLSVNVSELDVQVAGLSGTRAEKLAVQKQIYQRVVAACVATPACEAITTWGFTDRYSWVDGTFGPDDPLELDDSLGRKPAYYGMVDGFAGLEPDAEGSAPNLIPNATFEAGTDGWFGVGIPAVGVVNKEHSGKQALVATGRTDTWQGPGTNITALVEPGWTYDASAWVSLKGAKSDAARLSAKITCDGAAPAYATVAAVAAVKKEYTLLAGTLALPLCALSEVLLYAEGPAAGVDVLLDDVAVRPLSEPLGPNAITNSDFEAGIADWVTWAGAIAPSAVAHGGTGSVVVSGRTDTWQGPVYDLLARVTPGATYKIGGFARIAGAASAPVSSIVVSTCDGANTYTQVAAATATDQGFVALGGSYLVPTCNLTGLFLYFQGPPAGVDVIVDDVTALQRLSIPVVVPPPPPPAVNLAGNGGFELGVTGWFGFGASVAQSATVVHEGAAAGVAVGRTANWQGPAYALPSGPASYDIGLFVQQASGAAITLALSSKLTCNGADAYGTIVATSAPSDTWTLLQGTLTVPAGCSAAVVYVQQFDGTTFPDLYVDDLTVTPLSVSNLSGNPGFESGTGGWGTYGATLAQTTALVHGGVAAGLSSGRSADWMGPAFSFPTGAGSYSASLFALQSSGVDVPLLVSAKLTCNGVDNYPTVAAVTAPSGAWVELAGTFTVPSGCTAVDVFLHQSGGTTFPDLYVDDLTALPAN